MSTLFQIHSSINTLKPLVKELSVLWKSGDHILLLGEAAGYLDWFKALIDDVNSDDESESEISDIAGWFALSEDINCLNDSAKLHLDLSQMTLLTDTQWVALTQKVDRVVTLNSST